VRGDLARNRIFLLSAFLSPVIAGIVFMVFAGAPSSFVLANTVAAFAVAIAFWCVPQISLQSSLLLVAVNLPVLLACTFAGPAVDNVHRWIALGPLKLHVAMLLMPFLAVQMLRHDKRIIAVSITLAALVIALQPDRASAAALSFTAFCWLCFTRNSWSLVAVVSSGASLISTMLKADTLPPVRFVENVISDAAAVHAGIAVLMIATMLLAVALPFYSRLHSGPAKAAPFFAWSACLTGYFIASLVGPYPVPLIGYGVSPILGFGLALAMIGQESDKSAWATQ
jgi:hypothetical protein